MNRLLIMTGVLGALLAVMTFVGAAERVPEKAGVVANEGAEFFCDRSALTQEQRGKQIELGKILRHAVLQRRELKDGFEYTFPNDMETYRALAEYVPLERACCPFMDMSIRLDRDGGKLHWEVRGREGIKTFVREELMWLSSN
jgi:hypothetical protein